MTTSQPLIRADDLDAPLARRDGASVSRRQYLADVRALAARLPEAGPMLNISADRYRFAVGLGAAMLRGQANLMPPNHTPDTVARLRTLFPTSYALGDAEAPEVALPLVRHADTPAATEAATTVLLRAARADGEPPRPVRAGRSHLGHGRDGNQDRKSVV